MGKANCYDNAPGGKHFAFFESYTESLGGWLQGRNELVFKLRHESLLEFEPVGNEDLKRNRTSQVAVRNILLFAIRFEGKSGTGIIEGRCKTFRFEMHAPRHVCTPGVHRASTDSEVNAKNLQMGGNGQPIRSSSDYCHIAVS